MQKAKETREKTIEINLIWNNNYSELNWTLKLIWYIKSVKSITHYVNFAGILLTYYLFNKIIFVQFSL